MLFCVLGSRVRGGGEEGVVLLLEEERYEPAASSVQREEGRFLGGFGVVTGASLGL